MGRWPEDKKRIIEDLERSIAALMFVQRHLELRYRQTGDPLDMAALGKLELVFQAWRNIRARDFEQGVLFDAPEDEDQDPVD